MHNEYLNVLSKIVLKKIMNFNRFYYLSIFYEFYYKYHKINNKNKISNNDIFNFYKNNKHYYDKNINIDNILKENDEIFLKQIKYCFNEIEDIKLKIYKIIINKHSIINKSININKQINKFKNKQILIYLKDFILFEITNIMIEKKQYFNIQNLIKNFFYSNNNEKNIIILLNLIK